VKVSALPKDAAAAVFSCYRPQNGGIGSLDGKRGEWKNRDNRRADESLMGL